MPALVSIASGVTGVMPYNKLIELDRGCALFLSFVVHVFTVARYAPRVRELLPGHHIPFRYHAVLVAFGFAFNFLRGDALGRLPVTVCMILMNMQMLMGVVVQRLGFGQRHSIPQLAGCAAVIVGIIWASHAMGTGSMPAHLAGSGVLLFGMVEMLGAVLSLTLLVAFTRVTFQRYGEHVEEQVFIQHLGSLPLFLLMPGQWDQIGPRLWGWEAERSSWRLLLLLACVLCTFADRASSVRMAGRAPSLLTEQLVQTLKKFLELFVAVLTGAPPAQPVAFSLASGLLLCGTVQFLSAADAQPVAGAEGKGCSRELVERGKLCDDAEPPLARPAPQARPNGAAAAHD